MMIQQSKDNLNIKGNVVKLYLSKAKRCTGKFLISGFRSLSQAHGALFSRVLRDATPRFVGLSVGPSVRPLVRPSVRPSHFTFSALMGVLALLLLPKCSTDLNYDPCPPARDWGSRVSDLVFQLTKEKRH